MPTPSDKMKAARSRRRLNLAPRPRITPQAIVKERIDTVKKKGIYLLPNLFTLSSLFSGFFAVVVAIQGDFEKAALAIFVSMVLDGCDGRVARLTHTSSQFGVEFDSLADMCAFGMAPALVMYQWCLHDLGRLGWAAAFVYCAGAALRLARFNTNVGVVDKSFFQGLPSPPAAALVAGFVWLAADQRIPVNAAWLPWLALVITVYAGLTMVCNAPFYSGKSFHSGKSVPFWVLIAAVVVLFIVANDPALVVFVLFCCYALSGFIYQFYLWYTGQDNPVRPKEDEIELDEPEEPVEAQDRQ
ncbi:CDP-diacylglycerol--serine O-phosphatidyltransferase [Turicimonas muris]|uniref:CDP-diacylglycerol--serine O-phosphatidyltransferase n=2 Tax=Turicimonas muris TaxID=1796652 RepID=UPI003DA5FC0A